MVIIEGEQEVNEGEMLSLSANVTVDIDTGGMAFFQWCTERGSFQSSDSSPDFSTVTFIAPLVSGNDEVIKIFVQLGDSLGHIDIDTITIRVKEIGNYNPENPKPDITLNSLEYFEAGKPYIINFQLNDKDELGNDVTDELITDIFYSVDGVIFEEVVRGLQGDVDNFLWIPTVSYENCIIKLITTDGNSNSIITSEQQQDSDSDNLPDAWEITHFGNLNQDETTDFDNDGIPDIEEYRLNLNPTVDAATTDSDSDGYSDLEEYNAGTNPNDPDDHPTCAFSVPEKYPTIQEAINAASQAGGGQICVSPGTYFENITIKDRVWLTSTSEDPADTIIDGNGIHDVVVIHGSDTGGIIGFTIQNSQQNGNFAGIKCEGNETLTIANCIIKNNNHGIKFGGNSEPLIVNNVITQNIGDGIHTTGNPAGTLYNNIITQNQGVAIYINGKNTLTTSYNNLWENGEGKKNQNDTVTGLGNIAEDPAFLNPEFGDYHLVSGSPCIDTGHPKYVDPDGTPSDMGVYGGTWKNLAQTPPADVKEATTLTVTLDCPDADLTLYAPDERACGKDVSQIPEAKHETTPNGGQSVSVKKPEKGNYRAVLKGNTDQDCNLTVTTFMDDAELSTETRLVKVKNHKSVRANIPLNYPAEYPRFTFGILGASKKPDGSELKGDLNGDGEVDVEDVMKAASKWNKKAGDPDFDAFYDFDEDGDIDLDDVMHISDDWFVYEP